MLQTIDDNLELNLNLDHAALRKSLYHLRQVVSSKGPGMDETVRVGMVVDPVGSYGRGVIRGIMSYAREKPSWVITIEPRWSFDRPLGVEDWDVDGLIVQIYSKEFEAQVRRRGIPTTNVSNFVEGVVLPTVVPDDPAIGRMAAEYLRGRGFKNFGFFGPVDMEFSRLRCEAFVERIATWGIGCELCDPSKDDVGEWVRKLPRPAAVLGCNDDWAHRLLAICRRNGVRVPDEIAVLGVDNDELINALVTPSLSSVNVPSAQAGYEAARLLGRMLEGETVDPNERRFIPPQGVVTRQSTDVLAMGDAEVAAAVRFIRDRAATAINVDDVLREVALSRRSLERRFKDALGRGIAAEIRRVRMAKAKQLLAETDLSMLQVAMASGFGSATRLGIVFRQVERMTPSDYRKASTAS